MLRVWTWLRGGRQRSVFAGAQSASRPKSGHPCQGHTGLEESVTRYLHGLLIGTACRFPVEPVFGLDPSEERRHCIGRHSRRREGCGSGIDEGAREWVGPGRRTPHFLERRYRGADDGPGQARRIDPLRGRGPPGRHHRAGFDIDEPQVERGRIASCDPASRKLELGSGRYTNGRGVREGRQALCFSLHCSRELPPLHELYITAANQTGDHEFLKPDGG